jgi:hypothetical protein
VPLYQVEVSKVLVARVYIDAEDEEEAESVARQELPDDDAFDLESVDVVEITEHDDREVDAYVHNGSRRGERVSDWMDDDSED